MTDLQQVGRLALRHEGSLWVGYFAMPNTMEGAIFLGSIRMQFVQDKQRKKAFMRLMREAVNDILEEQLGKRPIWKIRPAPESERGGNA